MPRAKVILASIGACMITMYSSMNSIAYKLDILAREAIIGPKRPRVAFEDVIVIEDK